MHIDADEYFAHYGTPRHSGRYPWGSGGDNPDNQRNRDFLAEVKALEKQGMSQTKIAEGMGMSTTELRAKKSIAKNQEKAANIAQATRLKDKGMSTNAIAKQMGHPEPTVRNWLKPGEADKTDVITNTANLVRERVDEAKIVDVGKGVENYLGVPNTRLNTSLEMLKQEGYGVYTFPGPQVGSDKNTKMKVIAVPGISQKEVWERRHEVALFNRYSEDGGREYGPPPMPPIPISPRRVGVKYAKDGGGEADGVIYVRPGVKDLDIGASNYAQVRIQVGQKKYLKGMAIYKDDLPAGVDLLFNTSKDDTGNKLDAMKDLTDDPDLPFGSIVRQVWDTPDGKWIKGAKVKSAMNIVNDDEDWTKWSRTLSSQFLSKQKPILAKSQLDMTYERRQNELAEIKSLTNPTVRKKLLNQFADSTDSASVHLKAAALPGQGVRVLLPVSTLSPTQVYAPGYTNGDRVVLVRHPHGGTFELPELVVNNRHPDSKKLLGDAKTAIGINHKVALQLSGADFDGDTVLVIPNKGNRVNVSPPLDGLKGFDPHRQYPEFPGMKPMRNTQTEMGKISNLITDMTIKGASHEEIARAVRHSMVVIDAEKHNLNHRLSYNDNNIKELKAKYQRQPDGSSGAATLISRAKSEVRVPQREERKPSLGGPVDPRTGEKVYTPTNRKHWKTGQPLTTKTTRLAEAKDAYTLSSGTHIENLYADYSNKLKGMANQARLEALRTPSSDWIPSAKKTYASEVSSLNSKLDTAKKNKPLERQAQLIADANIRMKKQYNPTLKDDKKNLKKVEQQAINTARHRVGAGKERIEINQREWDAIQAGAISDSKLTEILNHADMEIVRQLATPRTNAMMTDTMLTRARVMAGTGATRSEIAAQLGVSVSTLDKAMAEG